MKANEFVKIFGWDAAKNIVDGWIYRDFDDSYHIADGIYCNLPFDPTDDCGTLSLYDLKRLVESHGVIEACGGIHMARADAMDLDGFEKTSPYWVKIKQAILDVESCQ